jgi:kynurenine aminotransferase
MWDRTITVLSAGKSFACTGWRVGYLIGPESLIGPTLAASTRIVFCANSPLQEAAAAGLEQAKQMRFFEQQLKEYQERRDTLLRYFDEIGLKYSVPEGTYFVLLVRIGGFGTHPFSDDGSRTSAKSSTQMTIHSL